MKKFALLAFVLFSFATFAQNPDFNVTQVSNVQYPEGCNDIWGYVDQNGMEYAVLGTRTATVVLSLEDPAVPQQIYRVDGGQSTWRDMKTWETFIYSVCDNCPDGLVIIDMTDPENPTDKIITTIPDLANGGTQILGAVHNIYIDEFGFLYLSGGDQNDGGVVIIDVDTDPLNPTIVGYGPFRYSHDVYVRDNLAYSSDIRNGFFSVLDVSDKNDVVELATQNTISLFTHNAWLSDDGNFLFTTDERDFAYIESHDVSDLTDIKRVDAYRPPSTEELGVTPHNVHVFNDYIIASYYTDGCKIIDAQYPNNLIEVGSFDTWFDGSGGTNGNWGAYPFLPSGLVLISDIVTGLHVLQPNYLRASYLEGLVTDMFTGGAIPQVQVDILGTQPNLSSTSNFGEYKTGIAQEGIIQVQFSHPLYRDTIVSGTFTSDSISILNVAMEPLNAYVSFNGTLTDSDGNALADRPVFLAADIVEYSVMTDANGNFTGQIFDVGYVVSAGIWGFGDTAVTVNDVTAGPIDLRLPGAGNLYTDRFLADQGWEIDNQATTGDWERGLPEATFLGGELMNPGGDSPNDFGDFCYVTGLAGSSPFDNDVDGVFNTLLSPGTALVGNETGLRVTFDYWFENDDVNGPVNDTLKIFALFDTEVVATLDMIVDPASEWRTLDLGDILNQVNPIGVVGAFQIQFEIGDTPRPGSPLEAGIDNIRVEVTRSSGASNPDMSLSTLQIFPNPVNDQLTIDATQYVGTINQYRIYDMTGKLLGQRLINDALTTIPFDANAGLYVIQLLDVDGRKYSKKLMKL